MGDGKSKRKQERDDDEPILERQSESFWNKSSTKNRAMAIWTINDQKKLVSLNGLYLRMMEFHRNVHTKETPLTLLTATGGDTAVAATFDNSTILANVVTFSGDKSKRLLHPMNYTQLHGFAQQNLTKIARKVAREKGEDRESATSGRADVRSSISSSSDPNAEYYWISLKDLNGLEVLSSALKIHDLIQAGFHDLRAHSNMLRVSAEIFMSNIVCSLEGNSFRMYKMFFYICENVLITHEVELFPNLSELEDPSAITPSMLRGEDSGRSNSALAVQQALEAVMSPINSADQASSSLDNTSTRTLSTSSPFISTLTDRVMTLFFKHIVKLKRKILQVGLSYLIYEISSQMIGFYDNCLEFVAFALSYFGRVVHVHLLHRERMAMLMKIHLLSAGMSLLRRSVEGCVENYSRLAQVEGGSPVDEHYQYNAMSELMEDGIMGHPPLMRGVGVSGAAVGKTSPFGYGSESALYLMDIHDSFIFLRTCLQRQSEELKRVEGELEATIQLRTSNTNTMLSLIATTFLPLTFFAGVFGMNFTEDGGYSIDLLNAAYGPNVFVGLCLMSFCISLVFFSYQGWLEFGIFAKFFKTVNDSNTTKIDDTKNVGTGDEDAIQRAAAEETRRKEESMFMRTSYSHFSSRLSSFRMSRRPNSQSQIQNFYPSLQSKQSLQEQMKTPPANSTSTESREPNPMNISNGAEKDF